MTLSERSLGWLRYLDRKAHTPDNWDRFGHPHPHWDDRSDPPMGGGHRADLMASSYAMGLMAHRTPAWTERYVKILDQLIERHTSWWSAADWYTSEPTEGPVNGPTGQRDPLAADAMVSHTASMLVLAGIRSMIEPNDRWNTPFSTIRDGHDSFVWTHSAIAENLCRQWTGAASGLPCENSQIWPARLAAAGLGLWLHDNRHGTTFSRQAFEPWWAYARRHYLDLAGEDPPATTTLYVEPGSEGQRRVPVAGAMATALHAAPQQPDDARRLFDAAITSLGLGSDPRLPIEPAGSYPAALLLAREWGLTELDERLSAAIEACYEPTWDAGRGEFAWTPGRDEPHPRGQLNALLAAADAGGVGRWSRLSAAPLQRCPQVVDVDFPTMAFTQAEWVRGCLKLRLAPRHEDPRGWTTFRIVGAEPRIWWVHGVEGVTMDMAGNSVIVRVPLVNADLEFAPSSY